ncbi:MAG: hypothetical protein WDN01_16820 [Rhizomicrobium sp.]
MSANDFDRVFGGGSRPSFTDRLGRATPEAAASAPDAATPDPHEYRAYGYLPSGNVGETCEIARWIDGTDVPEGMEFGYRFLMRMGFVADEEIRLFLPDCIIVVEGRNLRELRQKLARRQVTFVRQYSARVWPKAPAPTDPIIERVTITVPDRD